MGLLGLPNYFSIQNLKKYFELLCPIIYIKYLRIFIPNHNNCFLNN
jgi:hypothetical protein